MEIILTTLLMTHLTIVSVTLYLHRCQAHNNKYTKENTYGK
jgi:hypothetical protein